MDIEKWMNIWGRMACAGAVEYVAERLYHYGATASDVRRYNVENLPFSERVAASMDFMKVMADMED